MFKDHGSKPQGFDLNHDLKWTALPRRTQGQSTRKGLIQKPKTNHLEISTLNLNSTTN